MTRTNDPAAFAGFEPGAELSSEQIEAKARELLPQLTLDEKIEMMDGDVSFWSGLANMMGGGYGDHPWHVGVISRLGIPGVRFADGPRGVVMEGATTFPVSMARGAAWDVALEERIGDVIGCELRALGGNLFGGVCINLLRHPAWGRAQETYGEDSYHVGEMGAALTRGVQQHAMACVKHYALNTASGLPQAGAYSRLQAAFWLFPRNHSRKDTEYCHSQVGPPRPVHNVVGFSRPRMIRRLEGNSKSRSNILTGRRPTRRCSGHGCRGSTWCLFSFAVVSVIVGCIVSAATRLSSGPLASQSDIHLSKYAWQGKE